MTNISKMKNSELENMLIEAKKELARRDKIKNASEDIEKVLKKYQLQASDIDWGKLNKSIKSNNQKKPKTTPKVSVKTKTKKVSKIDQRSSVAPKYLNPNGQERWTGRGRTPSWVTHICEHEKIDIGNFKQDPRFKV